MKFNVYGVSDWPEDSGRRFLIFDGVEFASEDEAVRAAKEAYSDDLEVEVEIR